MLKRLIVNAIYLLLSILLVSTTISIFFPKDRVGHADRYRFHENEILFLGTSHVGYGIEPLLLYKQIGVRAYNLKTEANGFDRLQVLLNYILDNDSPKLIVIGVDQYWNTLKDYREQDNQTKFQQGISSFHKLMDTFPLSVSKMRCILDWSESFSTKLEFIFPFYTYHARWKELEDKDFRGDSMGISHARGWECKAECEGNNTIAGNAQILKQLPPLEEIDDSVLSTDGARILREMIENAHGKGAEVLLINCPTTLTPCDAEAYALVQKLADDSGVRYLNLSEDYSMIDTYAGVADKTHMNPIGAKQLTDYVGKYILEHYSDILSTSNPRTVGDDQSLEEDYLSWHKEYSIDLSEIKELNDFLVMAYQDDYDVSICINNIKAASELTRKILKHYGLADHPKEVGTIWLNRKTYLRDIADSDIDIWVWSRLLHEFVCIKSYNFKTSKN